MEIKHKLTNEVLLTIEGGSLQYADLRGANLQGADLRGASLPTDVIRIDGMRWDVMIMKAEDLALQIEDHVSRSFLIYGVKALHLTKENALTNDIFYDAVEILKSKGYEVRESDFLSESRLPLGDSIGFEISLQIDEMLNKASKEYFLIFLKNTIASSEAGETFKLDRPNKQLAKDFWSAIHKLASIGVVINQKISDFANDYTRFEFTWSD